MPLVGKIYKHRVKDLAHFHSLVKDMGGSIGSPPNTTPAETLQQHVFTLPAEHMHQLQPHEHGKSYAATNLPSVGFGPFHDRLMEAGFEHGKHYSIKYDAGPDPRFRTWSSGGGWGTSTSHTINDSYANPNLVEPPKIGSVYKSVYKSKHEVMGIPKAAGWQPQLHAYNDIFPHHRQSSWSGPHSGETWHGALKDNADLTETVHALNAAHEMAGGKHERVMRPQAQETTQHTEIQFSEVQVRHLSPEEAERVLQDGQGYYRP